MTGHPFQPVDDPSQEIAQLLAERRAAGAGGLAKVAGIVGRRFRSGCVIYLRSEVRAALVPVAAYHDDPAAAARFAEFIDAPATWSSRRLIAALDCGGSVLVSGDPTQIDDWLGAPRMDTPASELSSLLAVPVQEPGEGVVGAIVLGRAPDRFTRADREALEALAGTLAGGLDRERLAWELRERIEAETRTARELYLAEQRFSAAFQGAPDALALFSLGPGESTLLAVNQRLAALLGTTEEALRRHSSPSDFVHPDDRAAGEQGLRRLLAGETDVCQIEQRALPASDPPLLCEVTLSLVRDASGRPQYGICRIVDITATRRDEARLARHVRCQGALAALGRRAVEGAGWEALSAAAGPQMTAALGVEWACVFARSEDGGAAPVEGAEPGCALDVPLPPEPALLDARRLPKRWLASGVRSAIVAPVGPPSQPRAWVAAMSRAEEAFGDEELQFVEATAHLLAAAEERRTAEARARVRALVDPLTGLPNRTLLADRAAHATARAAREGTTLAAVCVDVDRFSDVNETFGHGTGDEVIRTLAQRLQSVLRVSDTLARTGGDEFAILCEGVEDERGAIEATRRIMALFDVPVVIGERTLHLSASIGVAVADGGSGSAEGLLRDADVAMHRAKARHGTGYELFDRAMRRRVVERLQLEQDLRRALEAGEFVLHYQPLVSLQEHRIVGVEALVRWQHPARGMVSPAGFVPLAEDTGLIVPLGRWVLDEACRQLTRWGADPALAPVYMSVNLSGRQLAAPGLAEEIDAALRRTGVAPEQLALELTETVLMEETSSPAVVLQTLQALGVRLLLDDFGTGYSSLNYVKRFPLNGIKVDRSFIAGIADDEGDRHLLRAIVSMASALGVAVIAEGVETMAQASWLASMGCDVAQGFGLARPAPADAIEPLLRDGLPADRLRWDR